MPPHLEAQLISKQTLYEMRFLSLARRAELIRREHGISLERWAIGEMYKRNGVKFLQAKKTKRNSTFKERSLELERIAFARKLRTL